MSKNIVLSMTLWMLLLAACSSGKESGASKNGGTPFQADKDVVENIADGDNFQPDDNSTDIDKSEPENQDSDQMKQDDNTSQDADISEESDSVPDSDIPSYEEPPLPPKLSYYFGLESDALKKKAAECGNPALSVSFPEGLQDHLTTDVEYNEYKKCLKTISGTACSETSLKKGDLSAFSNCLYSETKIYDPFNKPDTCPYQVKDFTFDERRELFSLNNAYWLLNFSVLSKDKDAEKSLELLSPYGFIKTEVIQKGRLQVLMAEHKKFIVFAFKGTTNWKDYLSNAEYVMLGTEKTDLPGKVHSGFFGTLNSGWEELKYKFTYAKAKNKTVIITGHSLGGAVAQMAALKAVKMNLVVKTVYVFASPRAGNEDFAKGVEETFGARFFRINNGLDITPHVAPSTEGEAAAKEAFLSFIGDVKDPNILVKGLDSMLNWGLNYADYTHPNDEYWIDGDGYFQGEIPYDDSNDIAYYKIIREKFDGNSFFDFTSDLGMLPQFHDDGLHLCYQARMIRQLIYTK